MSETKIDDLLNDNVAAIVMREHLVPVEGEDGVLFPATFAAAEGRDGFKGGYNVDELKLGDGKHNVCLIDSVGSQANRIEPMFSEGAYAELVPQIVVKAGERKINLLEAGHRAGDAIVRCSELQEELQGAFKAFVRGDAEPLARVAPTSLVFGVWDSRETQAKAPRVLAASIRAFDVELLTRSAQFVPATNYVDEGLLEETEDKTLLKQYSERGFTHVPASASHGGVIARQGVRRESTLHLGALRLLRSSNPEKTNALRRYVLGLALTAFTRPAIGYLRQGCNLVRHPAKGIEASVVQLDGRRPPFTLSHEDALTFAKKEAKAFKVSAGREVEFDKDRAKKDLAGSKKAADKKPKKGK
ncbi:MAG: type I-U CRISPR-associated protein Cas7 [Archangium sp.]|nr:type I-U CRISPR-associated protein Cas7 [Archangium sp.]